MITVEHVADGVATVTLDDGKVNVLDLDRLVELTEAVLSLTGSAVVLTGAGKAFCAGVDLRPVVDAGRGYVERFLPALDAMLLAVFDHPRPVVAAVNGHALAGGCVLAMAADRRLMSAGTIGVTELLVGVPFPPTAFETVRMVAGRRAADLIYSGRRLDPEQALAAGIVDEVAPAAELITRALTQVRAMASIPADTFVLTKHQLRRETRARIERDTEAKGGLLIDLWCGAPVQAAIRRYLDGLSSSG